MSKPVYIKTTRSSIILVIWETLIALFTKYLSQVAVRTNMQSLCFSPSLVFAPVVSFFIFQFSKFDLRITEYDDMVQSTIIDWTTKFIESSTVNMIQTNVTFALAVFSFIFLTDYIWRQKCKPYALERDTFVLPGYRALHTSVEQILNRRVLDENETGEISDNNSYIFICTTLWHENPEELKILLKSLLQLILHKRKNYDFEINIFFDNTFEDKKVHGTTIKGQTVLNRYVEDFLTELQQALKLQKLENVFDNGRVYSTPFGGRLTYTIHGVELIVHLKDASKVQRGKRWSQVMYMYYLLGWKIDECKMTSRGKTIRKETSYILAIDGDIEFTPVDFELVLQRLDRNRGVAACCNQIEPSGVGPIVWFQRFEYAIGHWFQKSAEHVLGCVLCSPGCFSLIRVEYLMRPNVMAMYKSLPTTPMQKLMYDQGEDRWLCTLILLTGGRIEFEAASHCQTFAPETFDVYYNQRRRWGPSTGRVEN